MPVWIRSLFTAANTLTPTAPLPGCALARGRETTTHAILQGRTSDPEEITGAHVRAVDYLFEGGDSVELNLGTGMGTTVKELLTAIEGLQATVRCQLCGPTRGRLDDARR